MKKFSKWEKVWKSMTPNQRNTIRDMVFNNIDASLISTDNDIIEHLTATYEIHANGNHFICYESDKFPDIVNGTYAYTIDNFIYGIKWALLE